MVLPVTLCAAILLVAGCVTESPDRSGFVRGEMNDAPAAASDITASSTATESQTGDAAESAKIVTATVEPWTFGPYAGKIIATKNYRVHTTLERESSLVRVPIFLESALAHYRTALGDLPAPAGPMDTYLFQTRKQWEAQMYELLPGEANSFINLGRGGLTTRGRSILYYIDRRGMSDTLAITAHEGWHQYTQTTFDQALPVWLEEGVATYMEGYVTRSDGAPTFRPWENRERYGALREAVRRDRMIPLTEIISRKPQAFLETGRRSLLTYYAQVWALTHFLAVGEGGKYREGLEAVIADAANGGLHRRLQSSTAITIRSRRELFTDRIGPWVILEYFNRDIAEFEDEFNAFVAEIVDSRVLDRMHADLVFAEE
jgi:hypothetical protein